MRSACHDRPGCQSSRPCTRTLGRPILLLTDRADHALGLWEELGVWSTPVDTSSREPNPFFYERGAWSQHDAAIGSGAHRAHARGIDLPRALRREHRS